MTDEQELARKEVRKLLSVNPTLTAAHTAEERQTRGAARVAATIRTLPAYRRRVRFVRVTGMAVASVSVAAAALFGGIGFPEEDTTSLVHDISSTPVPRKLARVESTHAGAKILRPDGTSVAASVGSKMNAGERLVVDEQKPTVLSLPSGAKVTATEGSVALAASDSATEQLQLLSGTVRLNVPRLAVGHRLIVTTADTTVVVQGTQFQVQTSQLGSRAATCVSVSQGAVLVRYGGSSRRLAAEQSWSSRPGACGASSPSESTAKHGDPPTQPEAHPEAPQARTDTQREEAQREEVPGAIALAESEPNRQRDASASSTLAAENRLFAAAVEAKRSGELKRALMLLDALLERHPQSPLAGAARFEHHQIQAQLEKERSTKP